MKLLLSLLVLFSICECTGQAGTYLLHTYASTTRDVELDPQLLAASLTYSYPRDIDKVRAIVEWITENIAYNARPGFTKQTPALYDTDADKNDTAALKPLSERVAIDVLKRKLAFCDGYARLFKTLCDYAGIKAVIISGYANGSGRRLQFTSNHRWNAVYIDSAWHLLDVTWASGFATFYNNEFVKQYNDHYFLTPPEEFIKDHFPEDVQWALLKQLPELQEFNKSPFRTDNYTRKNITDYRPQCGVIEANAGDTILFEVESPLAKFLHVTDADNVDSACIANIASEDSIPDYSFVNDTKSYCRYIVPARNPQWLQLVYDGEPVMRYRLIIRNNMASR